MIEMLRRKRIFMTDSSEIILKKKQMLADALSMMEAAQIIDFNGHFSARSGPDSMLINSGASVRSAITAADIVEIDLEGNLIGDGPVPPMEFHIHASIYRSRPDVAPESTYCPELSAKGQAAAGAILPAIALSS